MSEYSGNGFVIIPAKSSTGGREEEEGGDIFPDLCAVIYTE
jgi:hypothetical protein